MKIMITTQKVLFYAFNSLCFKHFCVVVLHLYSNWYVKDLAWLLIIFVASFSVLTAFWIIKTSQVKERSKEEKQTKWKNRGQQLQSSFALLEHFSKSIFYILIPFQSLGSQESNALNRVRFGAEIRKIWPSEDNWSRLVRNSPNTFKLCKICTTPWISHSRPCVVRNLLCFADSTWDLFF